MTVNFVANSKTSGFNYRPPLNYRHLIFFWLLLLVSCSSTRPTTFDANIELPSAADLQVVETTLINKLKDGVSQYRLSPGDKLELFAFSDLNPQPKEYVINVGDKLNIELFYHPEVSNGVLVRPDGRITMPLAGELMAAGLTPLELTANIRDAFKQHFKAPSVTVSVEAYSSKADAIKRSLTSNQDGTSKKFTLSPRGYAYLPAIEGVQLSDRTIDEAKEVVQRKYDSISAYLEVSLLLDQVSGNKVFVFGEVPRPGSISLDRSPSVLEVIVQAGGHLPTADISKVKVIYQDENKQPKVETINVKRGLKAASTVQLARLPPNSVIFVPPSTITKLDRWVDQYVRQLFLFNGSSVGFSYELHRDNP